MVWGAQQDDNFALNFLFYFLATCNRKKLSLSFPSSYPLSVWCFERLVQTSCCQEPDFQFALLLKAMDRDTEQSLLAKMKK